MASAQQGTGCKAGAAPAASRKAGADSPASNGLRRQPPWLTRNHKQQHPPRTSASRYQPLRLGAGPFAANPCSDAALDEARAMRRTCGADAKKHGGGRRAYRPCLPVRVSPPPTPWPSSTREGHLLETY